MKTSNTTSPHRRRPTRAKQTPCGFKIFTGGHRLRKYERAPREWVTITYPSGWRIAYP